MAGVFSESARPKLAGTYFNFLVTQPPTVAPSVGRTVAVCGTHTWGPLETPTLCRSFAEWLEAFGGNPENPSPGYIAVKQAFLGEASPDFGGAGAVLFHRMGGTGAAKATKVLQNTTPAAAITLTAKYEGTTGNGLKVTTQDKAGDSTKNQLLILDANGLILETFDYADTDINDLGAQINLVSDWVTATVQVSGTALGAVASSAFAGGNDGSTLVAQDYTDAMAALDVQRFGVLVFENLTDSAIQASLKTWLQGHAAAGRRFFMVVGGGASDTISTAITRSASFNDENIVNVGVGTVRDLNTFDVNDVPLVLSTAQLAPRIAGILANRGVRMSLTYAKLPGLEIISGPSVSDIVKAYDNGIVVLSRASDAESTVRIEKGLTTYTSGDPAKPKSVYGNPKFVSVMHGLQTDLAMWADDNVIGRTVVNDDTRTSVLAHINALMADYQRLGAVQAGWTAVVDPSPPPSDDDEFIAYDITAKFGRSTEQVYFTGRLG